jgi:ribosomal protein L7/L12
VNIFVAYAREDSAFALDLAKELKAAGADAWIDQLDIGAGERWDRAVEAALEKCSCLLVVLSGPSVESDNVMDEVGFALEEKKRIIPVLRSDCRIPVRLRRLQYIDFRLDHGAGIRQLFNALRIAQRDEQTASRRPGPDAQEEIVPANEAAVYPVLLTSAGPNKINVIKLVRELTSLGLKEAKDLTDAAANTPQTVLTSASPDEAERIRTRFTETGASVKILRTLPADEHRVVLTEVGPNKISVIKLIRELTRLGLKEAKDLTEAVADAPQSFAMKLSPDEAEQVRKRFEEAGASAQVQRARLR